MVSYRRRQLMTWLSAVGLGIDVACAYFAMTVGLLLYAGLGMAFGLYGFITAVWLQPGISLAPSTPGSEISMYAILASCVFWGAAASVADLLLIRWRRTSAES